MSDVIVVGRPQKHRQPLTIRSMLEKGFTELRTQQPYVKCAVLYMRSGAYIIWLQFPQPANVFQQMLTM